MSSKSKSTTTTTPYDAPAIKAGEGALSGAYGQAQGTISQYSPALQGAINQIQSNITTPPQIATDASANLDKTINGGYLDPSTNPYSSGMAKLIADRTQGEYNSTFGAAGRSHGGLAALLSGQGVGDALNNFYGNIYNSERGNQQAATLNEPAFHQGQYSDINELFPAVQNTSMLPLNAAQAYTGGLGSLISPYTTQTTVQKQGFNPLTTALGLAGMIGGAFMPMPGAAGGVMPLSSGLLNTPAFRPTQTASSLGYMSGMPSFGG